MCVVTPCCCCSCLPIEKQAIEARRALPSVPSTGITRPGASTEHAGAKHVSTGRNKHRQQAPRVATPTAIHRSENNDQRRRECYKNDHAIQAISNAQQALAYCIKNTLSLRKRRLFHCTRAQILSAFLLLCCKSAGIWRVSPALCCRLRLPVTPRLTKCPVWHETRSGTLFTFPHQHTHPQCIPLPCAVRCCPSFQSIVGPSETH